MQKSGDAAHMYFVYFRLIIGLSVALGLFAIELIGFLGGITMFTAFQSLICILSSSNKGLLPGPALAKSFFSIHMTAVSQIAIFAGQIRQKLFSQGSAFTLTLCSWQCLSHICLIIKKTCQCNIYSLKPHFYVEKQVCRGIPIFLISALKHRLWVIVRTASARRFSSGGSYVYPRYMFWAKIRKI